MAEIIEIVPGIAAIKKELASLRVLHASLSNDLVVTQGGVDVTAREATRLGAIIVALDAAVAEVIRRRR